MPFVDSPCATSLTPHVGRPGPFMKRLVPIYKEKTARDALEDYPGYYPAAKALAAAASPSSIRWPATWMKAPENAPPCLPRPGRYGEATPASFVLSRSSIPAAKSESTPAFDR